MHLLPDSGGKPDPAVVADLRLRYDIEQITAMDGGRPVASPPG